MTWYRRALIYGVIPILLSGFALALRLYFFSGFILCDDAEEFSLIQWILGHGADFQGHLQYRFPMWWFNVEFMKLMGTTEIAFFLPTLLMSSSLAALAYALLKWLGYSIRAALFAGLFIATAPFEVLLGTLRANDLILAWFLAPALAALLVFEKRPWRQGTALAVLLWLAFYTKLWAVYLFPALGVYYLLQLRRHRQWQGLAAFSLVSVVLHLAIAIFWKIKLGVFLPFLQFFSATYPVKAADLWPLFREYPHQVFLGSEFGTTLFGYVPYILILLLIAKIVAMLSGRQREIGLRFDRIDLCFFVCYASFFLCLNFIPNNFKFDQYYSAPRIFRYLAPISWPMALHAAKLILDLGRLPFLAARSRYALALGAVPFLALNLVQSAEATGPGRVQRQAVWGVVDELRKACPPRLLIDSWQGLFFDQVYLAKSCVYGSVSEFNDIYSPAQHETWLAAHERELPEGTMMVSGLASCVFYGCYPCGFQVHSFKSPLSPRWTLHKEFHRLDYRRDAEPVRIWRFKGAPEAVAGEREQIQGTFEDIFKQGMSRFDAADYAAARKYYRALIEGPYANAYVEDACYFYAVSFHRESDRRGTIREFTRLLEKYPGGRWSAAAYFHLGLAYKELGEIGRAREHFQYVLAHYPSDTTICKLVRDLLAVLPQN